LSNYVMRKNVLNVLTNSVKVAGWAGTAESNTYYTYAATNNFGTWAAALGDVGSSTNTGAGVGCSAYIEGGVIFNSADSSYSYSAAAYFLYSRPSLIWADGTTNYDKTATFWIADGGTLNTFDAQGYSFFSDSGTNWNVTATVIAETESWAVTNATWFPQDHPDLPPNGPSQAQMDALAAEAQADPDTWYYIEKGFSASGLWLIDWTASTNGFKFK
jgi:hypothetical protein